MLAHEIQPDQKRIVAYLANESHVPTLDVAELYEHERAKLAVGANVSKFVHIFAIRKVQGILNERAIGKRAVLMRGEPVLVA
jgi:hypothetical protein